MGSRRIWQVEFGIVIDEITSWVCVSMAAALSFGTNTDETTLSVQVSMAAALGLMYANSTMTIQNNSKAIIKCF